MKNFSISHFINEGTAVFFNQSTRDHYASAQATVENESPSIKNVWQSYYEFNGSSREAYYSIGGAFIQFLIEREGMDKFLAFISDQSYEHGVEIYGEKLEQIITDFETMLISG